jgi:SRSO17 transposase
VDKSISTTAAACSVAAGRWWPLFEQVIGRIAVRFRRVESRLSARAFVAGLLSAVERKNCWWLAEQAGHRSPRRMQRLLGEAVWDAEVVRDDVRGFVVDQLAHPDAVLICDETGFLKKGRASVGVQRQYSGTAGRIENSQVAVFLSYASARGRALIDRRLYVPRSWIEDPDRCAVAGIPDGLAFATKPQLAWQMIAACLAAGITVGFVTGDECYGRDPSLRANLRTARVGYVLAVARNQHTTLSAGLRERVDTTEKNLSHLAWQRYSCGKGSKGPRFYDWAFVHIDEPTPGVHSLLVRRNRAGDLAFYLCWTPAPVPLSALVTAAGARWAVEETFQIGKGQVGLDHYQCRTWTAWHRFTVLAMAALAILVAIAAAQPPPQPGLAPLSVPEARRLLITLARPTITDPRVTLAWSLWRRRHRATAEASHHKHRMIIESEHVSTRT